MPGLLDHQDWHGGAGPRVLVEAAEWQTRAAIETVLQGAGYRTVACAGPEGSGHRCALVGAQGCGAAERADVVVYALRTSDARNLEVLRALRRTRPSMPVIVEASAAVAAQRAEDFEGCVVVEAPLTHEVLLDALEAALGSTARP